MHEETLDVLTAWQNAAILQLRSLGLENRIDDFNVRENMLVLIQALDQGKLTGAMGDAVFMHRTEALLLAMLRGERIEVLDPYVYAARNEIFAAAQVIYNQAVARGLWKMHPEIRKTLDNAQ
jgi:hypothetical protein